MNADKTRRLSAFIRVHQRPKTSFAGETACATNGKAFASIGGAGFSLPALLVNGDVPAQVPGGGFLHGAGDDGHVGGHVMLEAVLADEAQQRLEMRNLDHAGALMCRST